MTTRPIHQGGVPQGSASPPIVPILSPMAQWIEYPAGAYEARAYLIEEAEGGFSIYVPSLPGVASQGETELEAIENLREAFRGAVKLYHDNDEPIPWLARAEVEEKPANAKDRWIVVHV